MQMHAIVEIEEGAMNVLVGHRKGGQVVVARSLRLPLADLSRNTVENTLRAIGSDVLMGAEGVHVVIGERRVFHQLATLPRLNARDAVALATRETLRQASIPSPEDLMLSTRLVRRLAGGKLQVAVSAFSRALWQPIAEAFAAQQLEVLSLTTMESCLAMAKELEGAEPVALIECNGNRARFVLCVDGVPMQVRRFLISGGSDDNEMALATQLTMEVPRTLDWLRETGQPTPQQFVIGTRVAIGDESMAMLQMDESTVLQRATLPVVLDEDASTPDIGIATLLHHLASGRRVGSLLDEPKLRLPIGAGTVLGSLVAASLAVLGGLSAVVDGREWLQAQAAANQRLAHVSELEQQVAARTNAATSAAPEHDPALASALSNRRPLSRLLAEVSGCAGQQVHIEDLRFASRSPVVVAGFVEGTSRQHALTAMATFRRNIDALPYLVATGQEEITETGTGFRFKLGLAWRNQ